MATQTDVLVVGAGIMGSAAAYHLKKNNPTKSVLLVDRYGAPGQGNTGRSNAMFRNTFSSSDNQVLSDSSIDFYLETQKTSDIGLQKIGYLWLMSEAQLSHSEPFLKSMGRNGIETRRFTREEVVGMIPGMAASFDSTGDAGLMGLENVDGAVFGPKCGRLDPDKLVRFYVDSFRRMGGQTAFNTDVTRLIFSPSKHLGIDGEPFVWQEVEVDGVQVGGRQGGEIHAKAVVMACGAWTNELLEPVGMDGHVKAKKRQIFAIGAKGSQGLERLIHTKGFNELGLLPMVVLPKAGVHFKPVVEENELWVACEDEINRPYIDLPGRDLSEYKAEEKYYESGLYPVLTSYFPQFKDLRPKSMWAGLYAYNTLDFIPFVFRERNLIVVGGDSGSGIMKGDALGRVADAAYRDEDAAVLFGGTEYPTKSLSFRDRDVEHEEWVI